MPGKGFKAAKSFIVLRANKTRAMEYAKALGERPWKTLPVGARTAALYAVEPFSVPWNTSIL